jgi:hypothetical protein
MMSDLRQSGTSGFRARALLAALLLLMTIPVLMTAAGCSGSGGSSLAVPGAVITRATEGEFSEDAKVLAARRAEGAWIPADEARRLDNDLARIRTRFEAVRGISAKPTFDLHGLLVRVTTGSPLRDAWRRGEIPTGDAALDTLLTEYGPTQVEAQPLLALGEEEWYVLRFDQSLNMPKLAALFAAAHPDVTGANANLTLGDGDDIQITDATDGTRTYTFSRGWGDCQAGCIERHYWEFAVPTSGEPSLSREWGSELP